MPRKRGYDYRRKPIVPAGASWKQVQSIRAGHARGIVGRALDAGKISASCARTIFEQLQDFGTGIALSGGWEFDDKQKGNIVLLRIRAKQKDIIMQIRKKK